MRQILKTTLLLAVALICSIAAPAQNTIAKPQKKQQTTTTTKPKTNTNKRTQSKTNTQTDNSSASISTNTQGSNSSTTTTTTTTTTSATKPTTGTINGHEWVDLGLSVKWATCNVGASSPPEYGNYYAWGETSTKSSYTDVNSKTYGKSISSIEGNPQYDAARANWGGTWRLPTRDEIDELINRCTRTWTTQGGHNGYKIIGPNGNSIFIPAAGWRNETSLYGAGEYGDYWSATPYRGDANRAYSLYCGSGDFGLFWLYRNGGGAVRPVSDSDTNSQSAATTSTNTSTNTSTTTNDTPKPKTGTNTQSSNSTTTTTAPKLDTGTINGHEWVDLGLSVKWATCNVGASSPSDYGNYYAWGETSTKSKYTWENSKTFGKRKRNISGNPKYDAARANWGSTWRLPTASEMDELINKCTWTWTSQGGHNGYRVKGPNGNSIFLPAAGWRDETSLKDVGEYGNDWSATPGEGEDSAYYAYSLYFDGGSHSRFWGYRYYGRPVRPVSE